MEAFIEPGGWTLVHASRDEQGNLTSMFWAPPHTSPPFLTAEPLPEGWEPLGYISEDAAKQPARWQGQPVNTDFSFSFTWKEPLT